MIIEMKYYPAIALVAASLMVSTASCSHTSSSATPSSAVENNDSIPESVKNLVKAVADNDARGFADLVNYPLERPYPLRNITDKDAMLRYYPVLVDDSLRRVITLSPPDDWHEYGWRGWSVRDGSYIWLADDLIISVNYVSQRETAMRDSLSRKEIASLAPEWRKGGWAPVTCIKAADGTAVYRIDLSPERKSGPAYRLMQFESPVSRNASPKAVYDGYMETDGTMMIPTWKFSRSDGSTAEYSDYGAGDEPLQILFSSPSGEMRSVEVVPAYWLDILK